ncbi:hypothetical protein Taro_038321 [Colocasia esculenta]|uniref:Pentatricopeptide repeat-containing protein n=1 Tax=Colocasia esculenta TaxID=4460 RepID=A0A843WNC7_COLES|nr:hypothetical protein [Colocasia esculenta]
MAAALFAPTPPPPAQKAPVGPSAPFQRLAPRQLRARAAVAPPRAARAPTGEWPFEKRMRESLAVLDLMQAQSMEPDPAIFCTLIQSCTDAGSLEFGRIVHDRAARCGLDGDPFVANCLVAMYAKCGHLGPARRLFDQMPRKNVVSWTTAIAMYLHAGFPHDALDLYRSMRNFDGGVKPNAFTYTVALSCCAKAGDLETGIRIHRDVLQDGCELDDFVIAALIDMYSKCGRVDDARKVFDDVNDPKIPACTAMVEGYNGNGKGKEAIALVRRIVRSGQGIKIVKELGFSTLVRSCIIETAVRQGEEIHAVIIKFGYDPGAKAANYLVELYEKCDKVATAHRLFRQLAVKNNRLWARLVFGYLRNGSYEEALNVYMEMLVSNVEPNTIVTSGALMACTALMGLEEGKQIHGRVLKIGQVVLEDSLIGSSLIELYSKFGEHEEASELTKKPRIRMEGEVKESVLQEVPL